MRIHQAIAGRTPACPLFCMVSIAFGLCGAMPARADEAATRPNIILIMTDDQSPTALGIAGNKDVRTPQMDRLAHEGVYFTRAYVPLPQCAPSRAALLAGRFPHDVGVLRNNNARWDAAVASFGGILREKGYRCGFVGKWHLGEPDKPQAGFDDLWVTIDLDAPKQNHYHDPFLFVGGSRTQATGELCEILTQHAREFIEKQHEQPFLLWLNYKEPHVPLVPPKDPRFKFDPMTLALAPSITDDLADKPSPQRDGFCHRQYKSMNEAMIRRDMAFYYAMLAHVDESIGKLLDLLAERKIAEKTLVIFMSDNGSLLGEHQMVRKGPALYEELVRVPLIFRWPGTLKGGQKRDALVSSLDLLPTLAGRAGATTPPGCAGKDIWPVVTGTAPSVRDELFLEYAEKSNAGENVPMAGVVTAQYKYTRYIEQKEEELYDLKADPFEMKNLARQPQAESVRKELAAKVDGFLGGVSRPFWGAKPPAGAAKD